MSVLSRVQLNPELSSADAAFLGDLVMRAKDFVASYCNLPAFPELSRGYSKSNTGASTNISELDSFVFTLSVNGSDYHTVDLDEYIEDVAVLVTGDLIASNLQNAINDCVTDDYWGFDEVTVAYSGTQYTIMSGRYGEHSEILISFSEAQKHLCKALKFSPAYGGTHVPGMAYDEDIESIGVALVECWYNKLGLEGFDTATMPHGFSFSAKGLPEHLLVALRARRRLI